MAEAPEWTEAETAVLQALYPDGGAPAVRHQLTRRSLGAIRFRAWRLGIKRRPGKGRSRKAWSDAEIHILIRLYPEGGLPAVQEQLPDRAESAIWKKATALGLRRRGGRTVEQVNAANRKPQRDESDLPARLKPATRTCLRCGESFKSQHCGNRLCRMCQNARRHGACIEPLSVAGAVGEKGGRVVARKGAR